MAGLGAEHAGLRPGPSGPLVQDALGGTGGAGAACAHAVLGDEPLEVLGAAAEDPVVPAGHAAANRMMARGGEYGAVRVA